MNRTILLLLLLLGTPLAAQGLQSGAALLAQQGRDFRAEYTVEVKDTAARLFHVTATFGNLRQRRLELALPVWTPGWFTIENYGKNVLRFGVKDGSGNRLPAPRVQPQTWSIDTRGKDRITVEFDYLANVVALNQAKITHEYAFFTGTQLFLEPVGHRDAQATVRIVVPAGWKIVSALEATSDSTVFRARDYDALVDAPTLLGSIQVVPFEVEGKPHLFAIAPAGGVAGDIQDYATKVAAVIRVQSALFGGLPYDKYIIFYLSHPAE
ncbi:MAG: hypothetical protein HY561_00100 [Gemmatimonadetes bacterium]|nr:hypothetical protein [Gemmatimonadota bacterium]